MEEYPVDLSQWLVAEHKFNLTKDERYERTRECMQIVKKAWTSREPFWK